MEKEFVRVRSMRDVIISAAMTVIGIVLNALLPKVKNEIRNFGAPEDLKRAEAAEKAAAKAAKSQHKK